MTATLHTLKNLPRLVTERLSLRPFDPADAACVRMLAGEQEVAATTRTIPHPYREGIAEHWIKRTRSLIERGLLRQYAVTSRETGQLLGCVSLRKRDCEDADAELAYWLGRPFWGRGYAVEAVRAAIEDAGRSFALATVRAAVLPQNLRSVRVLEKLGFASNGVYAVDHFSRQGSVTLLGYRLSPLSAAQG